MSKYLGINRDIWKVGLLALATMFFGLFPMMGLPGALILLAVEPVLTLFGISTVALPGDAIWPLAIFMTLSWPPGMFVAYLAVFYGYKSLPRSRKPWVFLLLCAVWAALLTWYVTRSYF